MSKRTYEILDLILLTFITCILDAVNIWAFKKFPFGGFTLSLHVVLGLIAIIRWGFVGTIVAFIGGISYSLFKFGLDLDMLLIYSLGNILMIINCVFFIKISKKKLVSNNVLLVLYVVCGYLLVSSGRGLVSILLNSLASKDFLIYTSSYFLYEMLNIVVSVIIMFIGRKQDGFIEDMNDYLVRVYKQRILEEQQSKKDEGSEINEFTK